jgi:hypothetical protein
MRTPVLPKESPVRRRLADPVWLIARTGRIVLALGLTTISGLFTLHADDGLAQSEKMVFQNFDGATPPKNKEGVGYPTYYYGGGEGGPLTITIDTSKRVSGSGSLKLQLTSGYEFYPQWNPWDGSTRDFARAYSANPSGWKFNTYNRFRFWFLVPNSGGAEMKDGQTNFYLGTYVKRITNSDPYSDETGGGHYYHPFNVLRNQWSMCVLNSHPGHERGDPGAVDTGNRLYPTAPPWGSGDPANTYNYFDTLTRFYIQETGSTGGFPRDYWIDEMEFYQESRPENDEQVYSICVSYTASTNRIFLSWNRHKDENSVKHEVRYAFSDIHAIGWNNAIPAPSGIITPPGWQGYNNMVYDTTAIDVSGKSQIYLAIKPQNSNIFSQVAFPLLGNPATPPIAAPANLRVVN